MKTIIIFGYQLRDDGSPQEILLDRMRKGLTEYHRCKLAGENVQIVFSGGNLKNKNSEASVMMQIALNPKAYGLDENLCIEKEHLDLEEVSADTIGNVLNSIKGSKETDDEVVFITSAFHVSRIQKFLQVVENGFAKYIVDDREFNYRVMGDERKYASEAAINYCVRNEKILEWAFLNKYVPRFVHHLIKVFQHRDFEFKLKLAPEEIKFEEFYNDVQKSLDLSCLHVNNYSFNDEFISALIIFLKNNEVKSLNLSGNKFGNKFACKLINFLMVNGIQMDKLNLDSNQLTDHSLPWVLDLMQSEYCPKSLNLGNNRFGQDAEHLGKFVINPRLEHLSLFGNKNITNKWLAAFLNQMQSSSVKKLDLSECFKGVKDKMQAVIEVKKFIANHRKLACLNLADCGFTDEMMAEICEVLPQLTEFIVYGNALTIEGVGYMLKAAQAMGSQLTTAHWFGYKVPADDSTRQELNDISFIKIPAVLEKNFMQKQKATMHKPVVIETVEQPKTSVVDNDAQQLGISFINTNV